MNGTARARGNLNGAGDVRGVRRRTLAIGAAWTAPIAMVGVAAPAMAASQPCSHVEAVPQNGDTVLTFEGSSVTATVAIMATHSDGTSAPLPGGGDADYETGEVVDGRIVLVFDEPDDQIDLAITMTLTFSQPVTGLSLTIADIDKKTGLWIDEVVVSPAGFLATKGANVIGSGTPSDPFHSNNEGELPDNDPKTHVTVAWPYAVQEVRIRYLPGDLVGDTSGGQHIGIGGIGFDAC